MKMKNGLYVLMVYVLLVGWVSPACSQNRYVVYFYEDVQLKSGGKYLPVEAFMHIAETDSIQFGTRGTITLVALESEYGVTKCYSNAIVSVKELMGKQQKQQQKSFHRSIGKYLSKQKEEEDTVFGVFKEEIDNDFIQAIFAEIDRFVQSGQKVNDNAASALVSCRMDFEEKLCWVENQSDSVVYIDVLYMDGEQCMSVFSSMFDWVSSMSVPPHSERTFWFAGNFPSSAQYLMVGSETGLPLNAIFKLCRPEVVRKEEENRSIELILRKL